MQRGRHLGENLFIVAAVFALTGLALTIGGLLTSLGVALLAAAAAALVAGGVAQVTAWIRPSGTSQEEGRRPRAYLAVSGRASRLWRFVRRHGIDGKKTTQKEA